MHISTFKDIPFYIFVVTICTQLIDAYLTIYDGGSDIDNQLNVFSGNLPPTSLCMIFTILCLCSKDNALSASKTLIYFFSSKGVALRCHQSIVCFFQNMNILVFEVIMQPSQTHFLTFLCEIKIMKITHQIIVTLSTGNQMFISYSSTGIGSGKGFSASYTFGKNGNF